MPIEDNKVIMTQEWRQGPMDILTQFTGTRCKFDNYDDDIGELKRELQEELGVKGGGI